MIWIGFAVGLFVGVTLGAVIMGVVAASRDDGMMRPPG